MKCRREFMKQLLVFALALSIFGQSMSCLTICADHAEQSSCASDESGVTSIEREDGGCLLDTLRFLPRGRFKKTPAGHVMQPLPRVEIFGLYHRQNLSLIDESPQSANLPHPQRIPALRI
jgi:hypothetical protein